MWRVAALHTPLGCWAHLHTLRAHRQPLGARVCTHVQGLATTLWSYAKLPVAPPAVVTALVSKITDQLVAQAMRADGRITFDAQVRGRRVWLRGGGVCASCGRVCCTYICRCSRRIHPDLN
jgi:hypothetical protein